MPSLIMLQSFAIICQKYSDTNEKEHKNKKAEI